MNYTKLLENKKCVITAGAHGMGFAMARLFVKHGGCVAVCGMSDSGIKSEEILRKDSPDSFFFKCDMGNENDVNAFADEILKRFGAVDVLVNNVGINKRSLIKDIDMEDYEKVGCVNMRSALVLTKRLIPSMIEKKGGSIINISSMNSITPTPTTGSYAISKGGMNSFTKVLSVELGKYFIRANAICPGWVATTQIRDMIGEDGGLEKAYEELGTLDGSAPLLSPGMASDIANHVLFLASDMSSFITGNIMYSDGAAIRQARACDFQKPDNEYGERIKYYNSILKEIEEFC